MNNTKDLSPFIHALLERFTPTDNDHLATHHLSTKEVHEAVKELCPGSEASLQDVFDALYEAGFMFRSPRGTAGVNFKWLLVEK